VVRSCDRDARFGGIRTFTMLGGIGGLAGWTGAGGQFPVAVVLLAAAAALVVAGYVAASRSDVDGTTEVSALVVLAAGFAAGAGFIAIASAVVALTTLLLIEKSQLHAFVTRIDDHALRASARFAVMAVVVLPLLPAGPFGPLDAIRPRELWSFVLFFSGLSFVGWVVRRLIGRGRGWVVAGLLGGVVSSTSVTLAFARTSRGPAAALPLAVGAIGACTVMLARVTVACLVLNVPLARALIPRLAVAFGIGLVLLLIPLRDDASSQDAPQSERSPLQLRAALEMAGLFQVVLLALALVHAGWGQQALMATSAAVGLTDLDALTLSIARASPALPLEAAADALTVGIFANTLLKASVALVIGRGRFRWIVAAALAAMAATIVWYL
jgi:uncharacterized membrane protein (DUF4010 family)